METRRPEAHFLLHRPTMGSGFSQLATVTTPAYLAAARCVAALMPGPARAALKLLHRTGTVHDSPPRGVSAEMSTEKLSFRGCGTYLKKLASSLHPQPTGAPGSGPARDRIDTAQARNAWSILFMHANDHVVLRHSILVVLIYT